MQSKGVILPVMPVEAFVKLFIFYVCLAVLTACSKQQNIQEEQEQEQAQAQFNCETLNINYFGARYRVNPQQHSLSEAHEHDHEKSGPSVGDQYITLWRIAGQVAHEYEQENMTFHYSNARGNQLFKMQYFDNHKRAIEFEPTLLNNETKTDDWQKKWQILPASLLSQLTLNQTDGTACNTVERYTGKIGHETYTVHWLKNLALPLAFEIHTTANTIEWQLAEIVGTQDSINTAMAQREHYQSTDFADIGDNESDPFLMSMINLGFIEHGNSGFYDSHGNDIGAKNGHAH